MKIFEVFCTIIFIDLVGSSIYSKILKVKKYAELVELFQCTAKDVYENFIKKLPFPLHPERSWFPPPEKMIPRGDEAVIFFTTNMARENNATDIELAIKFALQIKFEWKKQLLENFEYDTKSHIDLAVGINRGLVAAIADDDNNIIKVEGYEINYAKRAETASRKGKTTNIFLSEKARNMLGNTNILFTKFEDFNLRGLEENANLFEVNEFAFNDLTYSYDEQMRTLVQSRLKKEIKRSKKSWLEQYIISIFLSEFSRKNLDHYKEKIQEIIDTSVCGDKILYKYLKAEFLDSKEYPLLKLQYYQEIIKKEPTFIAARRSLVKLYEEHSKKLSTLDPIKFQIKNFIDEMLNFYPDIIEAEEKKMYEEVLEDINRITASDGEWKGEPLRSKVATKSAPK